MADLDNLSNLDLRKKLSEYGFGNMIITDTTRKVIISKLRKAMNGESAEPPKNNRRETINVVKPAIESEKNEPEHKNKAENVNRRATIAAAARSSSIPPPAPPTVTAPAEPAKQASTRRSGRITPLAKPTKATPDPTVPITINEDESSDDDVIVVPVAPVPKRSSKSRSPSLSKIGTATTSLKQMFSKPNVSEILEEIDSSDAEILNLELAKPENVSKILTRQKTPEKLASYYARDDQSTESARRRVTINYSDQQHRPITTSYHFYDDIKTPEKASSSMKRRQTTGIYSTGAASGAPDFNVDEKLCDQQSTPFLSDFARRLTRLKAEPLSVGVKHIDDTGYYRTKGRQPISGTTDKSILGLSPAYKRIFLIVFAIIAIIFIYIMFFTGN